MEVVFLDSKKIITVGFQAFLNSIKKVFVENKVSVTVCKELEEILLFVFAFKGISKNVKKVLVSFKKSKKEPTRILKTVFKETFPVYRISFEV